MQEQSDKNNIPEENHLPEENRTSAESRGCLKPVIAVVGFFVFLFLAAFLASRLRSMWFIPAGLVVSFGWAIFFSMDTVKEKINSRKKKDE